MTNVFSFGIISNVPQRAIQNARVAQLVERDLAKVEAAGSSPVSRFFIYRKTLIQLRGSKYGAYPFKRVCAVFGLQIFKKRMHTPILSYPLAISYDKCFPPQVSASAQIDLKVQGVCIDPESLCEEDVPVVLRNGHDPVLVIDQLSGAAAEVGKRFLVSGDKLRCGKGMILPERILIPGVRQDHGKAVNFDLSSAVPGQGDRPHVHLRLLSGWQFLYRLIAAEGTFAWDGMLLPQPGNVTAHGAFRDLWRGLIFFIEPVINLCAG